MRYVVSLSGGRDSAAVGIWFCKNIPKDCTEAFFVTADTGIEPMSKGGFYDFIDQYQKKILAPAGFRLDIVHAKLGDKDNAWDYEYDGDYPRLPGFFNRSCTDKLKIRPLRLWRKETLGEGKVTWVIGFRSDEGSEKRRMQPEKNLDVNGDEIWRPFPAMDVGLPEVQKMIADAGLEEPSFYKWTTRSGCALCFYKPMRDILAASRHEPILYKRMEDLEERTIAYWGDRKARQDHYTERRPLIKDGKAVIKKNGKPKLEVVKIPKKPQKPKDPGYKTEVRYFGRKASPWVAQFKRTLREIREADESQLALLDLDAIDERGCNDPLGTCTL